MSEAELLREALTYGTPIESAVPSHAGATIGESQDPDAHHGRVESGRRLPVNLTNRLCAKAHHRGAEWWGADGRLLCGICRAPANVNARWLRHGGPIGAVPFLGPTNAAVAEPVHVPKVLAMGTGPGPRNVLVELADGTQKVVPYAVWSKRLAHGVKNDESPPPEPPKRLRRGAVSVDQGSLLS